MMLVTMMTWKTGVFIVGRHEQLPARQIFISGFWWNTLSTHSGKTHFIVQAC